MSRTIGARRRKQAGPSVDLNDKYLTPKPLMMTDIKMSRDHHSVRNRIGTANQPVRIRTTTKPSTRSIMKQNFNKTLVATPVTNSLVFGETAEAVLESYSASQSNNNSNTKLH